MPQKLSTQEAMWENTAYWLQLEGKLKELEAATIRRQMNLVLTLRTDCHELLDQYMDSKLALYMKVQNDNRHR